MRGLRAKPPVKIKGRPGTVGTSLAALPVATGQIKNLAAYSTIGVPNLAAGTSYFDPVSGLRVWKLTSPTVPAANPSTQHVYSEGPTHFSQEWAPGWHTIVFGLADGSLYAVDHQRGVGLFNYRALPAGSRQCTFSQRADTPRILYIETTTQLRRYDTQLNAWADVGFFPVNMAGDQWLQTDNADEWFLTSNKSTKTTFVWRASTNTLVSRTEPGAYDEPYLARTGRFVLINDGTPAAEQKLWDVETNTVAPITPPGNARFGHVGIPHGFFVTTDSITGAGIVPVWRTTADGVTSTLVKNTDGYYPASHLSGKWAQAPGVSQYVLRSVYNWLGNWSGGAETPPESLALLRLDGGDHRFIAHHYSVEPTNGAHDYYSQPRTQISQSGKLAMFTSNMNNSPRTDVFVVELPEAYRPANPTALPVASGQSKNLSAYTSLNVPALAAGSSYTDPTSGLRVWKVTSPTVPTVVSNDSMTHIYSEFNTQISQEWAPGWHTILTIQLPGGQAWLADHQRGVGLSNWRTCPSNLTFSRNPATPRLAFVATGTQLRRYDTATNSYADAGLFPMPCSITTNLNGDRNDRWFVGTASNVAYAIDTTTGTQISYSGITVDDVQLDRDGGHAIVTTLGEIVTGVRRWNLTANTTATVTLPINTNIGHGGFHRGFITVSSSMESGTPIWRIDTSTGVGTLVKNVNGYAPDYHLSGQWFGSSSAPGDQWVLIESYNWTGDWSGGSEAIHEGMALLKLDGSDMRFVAHTYSIDPGPSNPTLEYYSQPRAHIAPSGKLVMWSSNMNGQARSDVFLLELPEA